MQSKMFACWNEENDHDRADRLRIEKRATDRKATEKRLKDAKVRSLGIDTEGIREQIEYKRMIQEQEKEYEKAYFEGYTKRMIQMRADNETKENQDRVLSRKQTEEVWKYQARSKNLRPEWDLNNPKQLKRDKVPTPESVGASACLLVDGKFPSTSKDLKLQKQREQFFAISEKVDENKRMREAEAEMERRYAETVRAQIAGRGAAETKEDLDRRETLRQIQKTNLLLAQQKAEREQRQRELDEHAAQLEHQHIQSSTVHREARFSSANGRVVRQEYKGFTPEMLEAVRAEQKEHLERTRRAKEVEKEKDLLWEQNYEKNRREAVDLERRKCEDRRLNAQNVFAHVKQQKELYDQRAREQKEYDRSGSEYWPWDK